MMRYVATINHAQEEFLAYLSSWGPLGTEIAFNIPDAAKDLGYLDRRSIYHLFYQLRDMGLVEMLKGEGYNRKTIFRCYARPEDCLVQQSARSTACRGMKRPRKPKPVAPRVVMAVPKHLIPYVGAERN
ncbi:hypothetical protein [Rhizobium lentis]|uniref:hypothetical protein n=1 Tax=Rhizobium lentis TaxID=1138194 RepID=UPI001C82A843|nr:hypothetical protein [Rhizobium lentis]